MSAAPIAVPRLDDLRPYFTSGQLQDHADRLVLTRQEDRTPIVCSLLAGGQLPWVPSQGDPAEQLDAALQAAFPNLPMDVEVASSDEGLRFTFEPPLMETAVNLHPLSFVLADVAPSLLPQLLGRLEQLTRHIRPVAGPRVASKIAEEAFDLFSLRDWFVYDKVIPQEATIKDALAYAREQGHNHPQMVLDAYPPVYFEAPPRVQVLSSQLAALRGRHHPALKMLAEVGRLLTDLSFAVGRLPKMKPAESEDVLALPAINTLFTVNSKPYCAAAEVADLHMESIWQGGEPTIAYALEVGLGLRSQRRLVRGLRALHQGTRLTDQICTLLIRANEACLLPTTPFASDQ